MPYHDALNDALEFEVLVARAARRGLLELGDLAESMADMGQSLKLDIHDPSALGAESLTEALCRLPEGMQKARTIWLVDTLDAFDKTPQVRSATWPWAWLDGETLLIACPHGLADINSVAFCLCILAHEARKWAVLCAAHKPEAIAPEPAHAHPENTRGPADDAQRQLALVAGMSVQAWQAADAACGGALGAHLAPTHAQLLRIHANLNPERSAKRARDTATQILRRMAEAGLGLRPVHLWVGPSGLTDTLSPYAYDLGPRLLAWGLKSASPDRPEASMYAVMAAFLASDARLGQERDTAERTVGVQRLRAGQTAFDLIDLGRIDALACEPALQNGVRAAQSAQAAPIILRLSPTVCDATAPLVQRLIQALAPTLRSVTFITDGTHATQTAGPIARIATHSPWHQYGGATRWDPARKAWHEALEQALLRRISSVFAVDVPMPQHGCPKALCDALSYRGEALSFGQAALVQTLQRYQPERPDGASPIEMHGLIVAPQADPWATHAQLAAAHLAYLLTPPQSTAKPLANAAKQAKPAARSAHRLRV